MMEHTEKFLRRFYSLLDKMVEDSKTMKQEIESNAITVNSRHYDEFGIDENDQNDSVLLQKSQDEELALQEPSTLMNSRRLSMRPKNNHNSELLPAELEELSKIMEIVKLMFDQGKMI